MKKMLSAIDWMRKQPLSTRLTLSAMFASVSAFSWLVGSPWPWGFVMAIIPLVIPRRSRDEDDFFREAKPTNEAVPVSLVVEIAPTELGAALTAISTETTAGFAADKVAGIVEASGALRVNDPKQFQFVTVFSGRPVSLQITVMRLPADRFELRILSDPELIARLQQE
jgi:hypothetical protein